MRLIDADALIEKWYEVNNIGPEDRGARFIGYTEIPRFINNAPTVQPTGDLISRADAIGAVQKEDCCGWIECKADNIYNELNHLPSVDAVSREEYEEVKAYMDTLVDAFIEDGEELAESVKVVRCKDCIHSDTTGVYVEDVVYCKWLQTSCVKNGYCHRADAIDACCRGWNNTVEDCIRNIKALPSADRPTFDKPTTKDALISREEVCEAIERYERHFNTKLETLKDLVAELPNYFTKYDTFCGVDMAEAIEVMTRYNADRPTRGRKDATEKDYHYCDDCEAVEMCMWYPYDGCQFKVSRPKGEWKCMADCGVTECDQCGWSIEEYVGDYNYCPNCGTRMKGGEDE